MDIRTENLTILFVDIAGFTATTSRQSRVENAHLLQTFERTLHPLVKAYKGTLVKSIGDALLLTFRSPTDAMLCAMALQDAMHGHNLEQAEENRIHIRVAASLGEVRVANKDIFGEPVNVSARIEGVTPADEIWLSEAVYLAMNKAEVPAEEVGFKELSGIPQAIRLYSIPRFATRRLVSEKPPGEETGSPILYPYGGMHQRIALPPHGLSEAWRQPIPRFVAGGIALLALGLPLAWWGLSGGPSPEPAALKPPAIKPLATAPAPAMAVPTPVAAKPAATPVIAKTDAPLTALKPEPVSLKAEAAKSPAEPAARWPTVQAPPPKPAPDKTASAVRPAPKPVAKPEAVKPAAEPPAWPAGSGPAGTPAAPPPTVASALPFAGWTVTSAKQAYRAGRLSKPEFRQVIQRLEADYEEKIRMLKLDYRAGRISRFEYGERVRAAKLALKGG
ncbi:MAG: hypothetical protein HYV16_11165 [Gammaproteobacteria bacterium]|nr:hypothetical protein [Gammaproteobacteria bacterium]